jgi:hypothetical protein
MKNLLIITAISFLSVSCGITERMSKNCGSDIEMGCNLIFGTKTEEQDERINSINPKNGINGQSGTNGNNGQDGINGSNGQDGIDGQDSSTKVTMVNLCEDQLTNSSYSEEAICVSEDGTDRLYAVLSGNTTAMVELLPNTHYQTTSPAGNNCRFYLGTGCNITFIQGL